MEDIGRYNLGETVNMYDSILNNSSLMIDSFEFRNKITYKYEACIRTNCTDKTDVINADVSKSKTLLVLTGKLDIDKTSSFSKNAKKTMSFFDAFVQIRFDNKIAPVENVTPQSITDRFILSVDENIGKAQNIDLIITIRNKKYTLKLK